MIKFLSLSLENFMSFKHAELKYAGELTLVTGINYDDPCTESNGSGKSSLAAEGLLWTLFEQGVKEKSPEGSTLAGFRKDDVIRHGAAQCRGLVRFELSGVLYEVERTRKRQGTGRFVVRADDTEIKAANTSETQEILNKLLGRSYSTFTQIELFGQGTRRFTQAKESERKEILDDILGLHKFKSALGVVRKRRQSLQVEENELNLHATRLEVTLENVKEQLETSKTIYTVQLEKYKNWRKSVRTRKETVKKDIIRVEKNLEQREGEVNQYMKQLKQLQQKLQKTDKAGSENFYEQLCDRCSELRVKLEMANSSSEILKNSDVAVCPVCRRDITNTLREKLVKQSEKEIVQLSDELDTENKDAGKLHTEIVDIHKIELEVEGLERKQQKIQSLADTQAQVLRTMHKQLHELDALTQPTGKPNAKEIEKLEKKAAKVSSELEAVQKKLKKLKTKMSDLDFWEVGFGNKGIKSLMLDSVLPVLNKKANAYLSHLMDETEVEFDTQTYTVKGEPRDALDVRIYLKGGNGYHIASGGERRRIDFCISLALQSLIASSSARSNIFVLDEPFESLDDAGIEAVVELLRQYAATEGVSVYVISHRNELKGLFEKVITIEKKNGISECQLNS